MASRTDITLVLDRSGSMGTCKEAMQEALNAFVADQKSLPGECVFSLVRFDTEYELFYNAVPIRDVGHIPIDPRGGTALLDAIGRAIDGTGRRLSATPPHKRPDKVLFVVVTDGEENASSEYISPPPEGKRLGYYNKAQRVFDMIKHQTDTYSWTFLFVGANQDAIATASGLGISSGNTVLFDSVTKGGKGTHGSNFVGKALSQSTHVLRSCGKTTDLMAAANASPEALDAEYSASYDGAGALDGEAVKQATLQE